MTLMVVRENMRPELCKLMVRSDVIIFVALVLLRSDWFAQTMIQSIREMSMVR